MGSFLSKSCLVTVVVTCFMLSPGVDAGYRRSSQTAETKLKMALMHLEEDLNRIIKHNGHHPNLLEEDDDFGSSAGKGSEEAKPESKPEKGKLAEQHVCHSKEKEANSANAKLKTASAEMKKQWRPDYKRHASEKVDTAYEESSKAVIALCKCYETADGDSPYETGECDKKQGELDAGEWHVGLDNWGKKKPPSAYT